MWGYLGQLLNMFHNSKFGDSWRKKKHNTEFDLLNFNKCCSSAASKDPSKTYWSTSSMQQDVTCAKSDVKQYHSSGIIAWFYSENAFIAQANQVKGLF